jgi:hypothetical protein
MKTSKSKLKAVDSSMKKSVVLVGSILTLYNYKISFQKSLELSVASKIK